MDKEEDVKRKKWEEIQKKISKDFKNIEKKKRKRTKKFIKVTEKKS